MYSNKNGKRALAEHALVRHSPRDAARPSNAPASTLNPARICATELD